MTALVRRPLRWYGGFSSLLALLPSTVQTLSGFLSLRVILGEQNDKKTGIFTGLQFPLVVQQGVLLYGDAKYITAIDKNVH